MSGDSHFRYQNSRGGHRAAEVQVSSHFLNIAEDVQKVAGNCDFLHRVSQLSAFNPHSRGAVRNISRHDVYTKSHEFGDIKTILYRSNHPLWIMLAGLYKEVVAPDGRIAGDPARSVSRGCHVQFARRITVQQI